MQASKSGFGAYTGESLDLREATMRQKHFMSVLVVAALAGSMVVGAMRAQEDVKVNHTSLKAGDMAPDFTLLDNKWKHIHLSDYRGKKNVVLAFYVLAFTEG
jgi:cytochrome oxidase Cu insertion factor (SCO1/SenC/PrrC family)